MTITSEIGAANAVLDTDPPPIIVINLDRDIDRLIHMERELSAVGLCFKRHRGVLGLSLPAHLAPFFDSASPLRQGEVGCYASHLDVLSAIAAGQHGAAAIVMEDDLSIHSDFPEVVKGLMKSLPLGWDMVRLSNEPKRAFVAVDRLGDDRWLIKYSKIPNGTGAYLVTPAGARKLLGLTRRWRPFDDDLRRPWNYDLNVYGVTPPPIIPDCLTSTIDDLEPGRLVRRGGVLGRLRRTAWRESWRRLVFNMLDLGFNLWVKCLLQNAATRLRLRPKAPAPIGSLAACGIKHQKAH